MDNPFKANYAREAEENYQIKERNGELWITYTGVPVVPQSLLKKDILEALKELRELYVQLKNN